MEIGQETKDGELPDYVDLTLSFEMDGRPGRNFLIGNPHTFPGRMEAYSEVERQSFTVSLDEMTNVSAAARAWISGYLSGSEPGPPSFTGDEHAKAVEDAWRAAVLHFESSGELLTITDEWKLAARADIDAAADAVANQSDFAAFLRKLDSRLRESSGRWTPVAGELFFDVWAGTVDSEGERSNYGLGESTALAADWRALARSVCRAVL